MGSGLRLTLMSLVAASVLWAAEPPSFVTESARDVPVAYRVDVVVVGGGAGAVAAAVAAAEKGAKVFLAAPRPYLGEDICGPLRLWLHKDEVPTFALAKKLFAAKPRADELFNVDALVDFTYKADMPSSGKHADTEAPSLLCDHRWHSASQDSVQYDGDVTITVDLQEEKDLQKAGALIYHQRDFQVDSLTVHASTDGKEWRKIATIKNTEPEQETVREEGIPLLADVNGKARYLRLAFKRAPGSTRLLIGEIVAVAKAGSAPTDIRLPVKPLHIKRTLDRELLDAKVDFLFSCYPTDVLRDADGKPCGIVMANRAGRQAVVAKVIIDATDRAWVARMAGAKMRPFPAGEQTLKRVVIGGEARTGPNITVRKIGNPYVAKVTVGSRKKQRAVTRKYQTFEYTLKLPMTDGSYASWAKAEQKARDMTYHPEQQFASEVLFQVPPDPIEGQGQSGVAASRPVGVPHLYVLDGCADVPREEAEKLIRPLALIDLGTKIGAAAAEEAKSLPEPKGAHVSGGDVEPVAAGDVREILTGVRPTQQLPTLRQEERGLPVLGEYDVVVIGGGTSGAPAGIGAARRGAKTLVVEYLYGLGGVGTLGSITRYCGGNRVGFTKEVEDGASSWEIEQKMEWWRTTLRKAGADIWFGCLGCGAFVDGSTVKGVVVVTPEGRGVVLAKVVIDSTGNADIAAAAGAPCVWTGASDIALQGTGLPCRDFGISYFNTDYTITDETDMVDVWQLFVYAKNMYPKRFDLGQLIDTRERRRIVGDLTVTILDQVKTFPDTIVKSSAAFDTHGYTVAPYLQLVDPRGLRTYTPYRSLLPKGFNGILVTGLGASMHRDAIPVTRMQPDLQNQGYAAGVAAAMAIKANVGTRDIDIRELQRHLVEIGNLPESVLTDKDSYPAPSEKVEAAVETVKKDWKGLGMLMASRDQALPLLRKAYDASSGKDKMTYAHLLAVMGDATGIGTLIGHVQTVPEWDKGWQYKAMGQFGLSMSPLDSIILAMGQARDQRALKPIIAKVKLLDAEKAFSHHRAVALALEMLRDPAGADALAELLSKPGMTGHACHSVEQPLEHPRHKTDTKVRSDALRELILARALYRCGDKDGLGKKILKEYETDLRGHFARHATAVLRAGRR
ncbi:MAG: FAD-dependent oxidoreductase [Planctomycetes bacterium]|nr:FAD-dependent oxidoreductase [Planctomycetota bacterium]